MLKRSAKYLLAALIIASGCGQKSEAPQFRSFDLKLTHPAPYSTYIQVSPGSRDAALPRFSQLDNKSFSEYLRESIGCVYDDNRSVHTLGSKRAPAGYMVPVRCVTSNR